ncbi:MAG: hypothetical protein CBE00_09895 [Planctomycetaceae bacterium TMED240]|nr:hypothetical protein [Rhodopirellula sp.]OUX05541.1 MAG: hypothetical protein CBE00_09895 [Planctomycetaceae bacterium TMED240]
MTSHFAQPDPLPTGNSLFAGVGSQKVWCYWGAQDAVMLVCHAFDHGPPRKHGPPKKSVS